MIIWGGIIIHVSHLPGLAGGLPTRCGRLAQSDPDAGVLEGRHEPGPGQGNISEQEA